MHRETLSQLHAPLIPILRHVLALAPLPRAGIALDLACGEGEKVALLIEALGPNVRLIGVDNDLAVMQEPRTENREPEDRDLLSPKSSAVVGGRWSVVADALALPLREGCCDTAFCIAALGLFADQRVALRELRRVLRPGAPAVLAVGTQAWAQAIPWPPDLSARLATAYAQALAHGAAPIPAAPDLGGELAELLADSGFAAPLVRAFWLDRGSGIGDQESGANDQRQTGFPDPRPLTPDPCLASELPLLPWPALRPLLADRLPVAELARCDALAAAPEIELCALALVALAHAGG